MSEPRAELRRMVAEKIDAKMHSECMEDHFDGWDYADTVMELLETVSFDDGPRVLIWTYPIDTIRPGYTEMRETPNDTR